MTKIQVFRQWAGAVFAFIVLLIVNGHANAGTEIALAMPMAIFFVCAAAYSSQKRINELQTQIDELRKSTISMSSKT